MVVAVGDGRRGGGGVPAAAARQHEAGRDRRAAREGAPQVAKADAARAARAAAAQARAAGRAAADGGAAAAGCRRRNRPRRRPRRPAATAENEGPADKPEPMDEPEPPKPVKQRDQSAQPTTPGSPDRMPAIRGRTPVPTRPPAVPRPDQPRRAHVAEGASPPLRLRARQSGRRAALASARTRLRAGRLVQRLRGAVRPGPPASIRPVGAIRRCWRIC